MKRTVYKGTKLFCCMSNNRCANTQYTVQGKVCISNISLVFLNVKLLKLTEFHRNMNLKKLSTELPAKDSVEIITTH